MQFSGRCNNWLSNKSLLYLGNLSNMISLNLFNFINSFVSNCRQLCHTGLNLSSTVPFICLLQLNPMKSYFYAPSKQAYDVGMTSMRCDNVASTSVCRHIDAMCPLGLF